MAGVVKTVDFLVAFVLSRAERGGRKAPSSLSRSPSVSVLRRWRRNLPPRMGAPRPPLQLGSDKDQEDNESNSEIYFSHSSERTSSS